MGKSNTDVYNIKMDQGNYIGWLDLNTIEDFSTVSDDMEMLVFYNNDAVAKAQEEEIQNWTDNDVFEGVEYKGQKAIFVRWVLTEKG